MVRHFYFIVLLTMMLNIILNVPSALIQDRFHGAIMSILFSVFIGGAFIYIFTISMSKFPQKGLPEIFYDKLPAFIRIPYLAFLGVMWMASGAFALISYSYVIKLYISPDMNLNVILGFFLIVIIFAASKKTDSILFLTEIIVIATAPLVAFILFKTLTSRYFYTLHILRMLHHVWQFPSYSSISAATYVFIGYINLAIINRCIDSKKVVKFLWILPLFGFAILCSSFFAPIAFLGINGVSNVVYPWIFIADSLRMEFGFIERVLYLLLCLYLLLILLFGIITWHIGLKLIEGMFIKKNKVKQDKRKGRKFYTYAFLTCTGILTLVFQSLTNQEEFFNVVRIWLNIRLPAELMLIAIVFFLSRRLKT